MTVIELSQVLGNFGEFFGAIAVVGTLVYPLPASSVLSNGVTTSRTQKRQGHFRG